MQHVRTNGGSRHRRPARLAALGAGLWLAAGLAAGQIGSPAGIGDPTTRNAKSSSPTAPTGPVGMQPPTPNRADSPPMPLYYGVVVVLAAATIALAIMPSKRGHQD